MLGEHLDRQVRVYLNAIHECGGAVNTSLTIRGVLIIGSAKISAINMGFFFTNIGIGEGWLEDRYHYQCYTVAIVCS